MQLPQHSWHIVTWELVVTATITDYIFTLSLWCCIHSAWLPPILVLLLLVTGTALRSQATRVCANAYSA